MSAPATLPMSASNALSVKDLPRESPPACAERGADGEFAFARGRASEQKLTYVCAGNEQHATATSQKQEQRKTDASGPVIAQRNHRGADLLVRVGILLREALGDERHLRLRLRHA